MVLLLTALAACFDPGITVEARTVETACARCVYEQDVPGCPWAVTLDGERYMVSGVIPKGHNGHAPDGMCNVPRTAVVDGHIRDGVLVTTRFELEPFDGELPDGPTHEHDHE